MQSVLYSQLCGPSMTKRIMTEIHGTWYTNESLYVNGFFFQSEDNSGITMEKLVFGHVCCFLSNFFCMCYVNATVNTDFFSFLFDSNNNHANG